VASRLAERYQRPAFVFAHDEDTNEATGSGRSVSGVDIGAAVRAAVADGLARKGGGHAMAAGITVPMANMAAFEVYIRAKLAASYIEACATPILAIDGLITPRAATAGLSQVVEKAGPFGAGNPTPRFALSAVRAGFVKLMPGGHLRCALRGLDGGSVNAIAFRAEGSPLGELLQSAQGQALHVAGRLHLNEWNGTSACEVQIDDAAAVA
jgi:single-stranded-DNA-specific exonuclease